MTDIKQRLDSVRQRIVQAASNAARDEQSVCLLAVSKRHTMEAIAAAYESGQRDFGENYSQELLEKIAHPEAKPDMCWHFIGPVQSNKTRDLAEHIHWLHSLDRKKIADRLSKQRPDSLPPLNVCIQVNIDDEDSKSGIPVDDAQTFAEYVSTLPGLRLRGLMAIPKTADSENGQAFARLAEAFTQIKNDHHWPDWDTLSMGMSADLEAAIGEGATIVRVGTDIFGPRD